MEGFLEKKRTSSLFNRGWDKRYFRLSHCILEYAEKKEAKAKEKDTFNLRTDLLQLLPASDDPKAGVLDFALVLKNGRTLPLRALNAQEKDMWLNALSAFVLDGAASSSTEPATLPVPKYAFDGMHACLDYLMEHGLSQEGLFRHAGAQAEVEALFASFLAGRASIPANADVHAVAGALKMLLREIPETLVTNAAFQTLLQSTRGWKEAIDSLPDSNREILTKMVALFAELIARPETKMNVSNLSICLNQNFVRRESPEEGQSPHYQAAFERFLKGLIEDRQALLGLPVSDPSPAAARPASAAAPQGQWTQPQPLAASQAPRADETSPILSLGHADAAAAPLSPGGPSSPHPPPDSPAHTRGMAYDPSKLEAMSPVPQDAGVFRPYGAAAGPYSHEPLSPTLEEPELLASGRGGDDGFESSLDLDLVDSYSEDDADNKLRPKPSVQQASPDPALPSPTPIPFLEPAAAKAPAASSATATASADFVRESTFSSAPASAPAPAPAREASSPAAASSHASGIGAGAGAGGSPTPSPFDPDDFGLDLSSSRSSLGLGLSDGGTATATDATEALTLGEGADASLNLADDPDFDVEGMDLGEDVTEADVTHGLDDADIETADHSLADRQAQPPAAVPPLALSGLLPQQHPPSQPERNLASVLPPSAATPTPPAGPTPAAPSDPVPPPVPALSPLPGASPALAPAAASASPPPAQRREATGMPSADRDGEQGLQHDDQQSAVASTLDLSFGRPEDASFAIDLSVASPSRDTSAVLSTPAATAKPAPPSSPVASIRPHPRYSPAAAGGGGAGGGDGVQRERRGDQGQAYGQAGHSATQAMYGSAPLEDPWSTERKRFIEEAQEAKRQVDSLQGRLDALMSMQERDDKGADQAMVAELSRTRRELEQRTREREASEREAAELRSRLKAVLAESERRATRLEQAEQALHASKQGWDAKLEAASTVAHDATAEAKRLQQEVAALRAEADALTRSRNELKRQCEQEALKSRQYQAELSRLRDALEAERARAASHSSRPADADASPRPSPPSPSPDAAAGAAAAAAAEISQLRQRIDELRVQLAESERQFESRDASARRLELSVRQAKQEAALHQASLAALEKEHRAHVTRLEAELAAAAAQADLLRRHIARNDTKDGPADGSGAALLPLPVTAPSWARHPPLDLQLSTPPEVTAAIERSKKSLRQIEARLRQSMLPVR